MSDDCIQLNGINLEHASEREIAIYTLTTVLDVKQRLDKQNGSIGKHDERIRSLEDWRSKVRGGLKVSGAVSGLIGVGGLTFGRSQLIDVLKGIAKALGG